MPNPKYYEYMKPILVLCGDQKEHRLQELYTVLPDQFKLTDEDKAIILPSGKQPVYRNRIGWAKTYLTKAGLIEIVSRGNIRITPQGLAVLKENPPFISQDYLQRFESFKAFKQRDIENPSASSSQQDADKENSPQDVLDAAYKQIINTLKDDLLHEIANQSPAFFENLVVDLLLAMGYGASITNAGKVTGKSGDEGIDGIVREDKLGFDMIYFQAKKWEMDKSIGRPEIQKFVGALAGQGASKGLFISTASFSKEAIDYASKQHTTKVVLVDGNELANLMIEHDLGVSRVSVYETKKIDSDYFDTGF